MEFKNIKEIKSRFYGEAESSEWFNKKKNKLNWPEREEFIDSIRESEMESFYSNNAIDLEKFFLSKIRKLKISDRVDGKDIDDLIMENDNDNKFEDWLEKLDLDIIKEYNKK